MAASVRAHQLAGFICRVAGAIRGRPPLASSSRQMDTGEGTGAECLIRGRMNRTRHPHWLTSYFTAARACPLARSLPLERQQTKGGDDAVRRHGTPGRLIEVPRLVSRYQASSTRMLQLRCRRHGGP
ncbi:hypothetical protein VFPFJ_01437 [Purpureocillium lilacinum]|uniref:Uncharacterized protein n=1 Tax=Purpureocillium lilacinum TaxID=33203 RepID=A0A179HY43_PURLI|nr:hypothetical protein VFPFJ_01437 [Purpureocillium lilacinum]OAQ95327.1 hypothetical protein VFPFJ_01437 [Purpureocillium lilacinum]